jgi:hypothetical protein
MLNGLHPKHKSIEKLDSQQVLYKKPELKISKEREKGSSVPGRHPARGT